MPPERNNTVRFSQLSALTQAGPNDFIPIVDTSIPTLVNKKITISGLNQSLPVGVDASYLKAASSSWDSVYASFNSNSAEYESTFSNIISNSSNWDSVYTSVNQNSAGWTGLTTYSTVNSLSDTWNTAYSLASSAYTSLSALSSGIWVLKAGDQMTGALTTTRTNTASFGLDEFVTKRYADALATATQISGNFVPGLYYTKADFQTGVVSVLSAVNLQTYGFALGASGGTETGIITFNPNLFGTSVTGYVFNSTNTRTGIRVIGNNNSQLNYNEGGLSVSWGGPTSRIGFFNLGDSSGNNIITVDHYGQYHPAPLTNTAVVRCNPATNLLLSNYNIVNIAPRWNNVATTFTGFSVSAVDAGSATASLLLDLQTNGISQFIVRKDGLTQGGPNNIYNVLKVCGIENRSSSNTLLTFVNPFDGTIGLAPTSMVQWGDPGNGTPFNNQGDVLVARDEAGVLSLRPNTVNAGPQAIRVYRSFVNNTTNFERFGLSGNRLAYELSGSQRFFIAPTATNDQIIVSTGNLTLSAAGSLSFSQSLPTSFSGLQGTAPGNPSSSYFKVLSSNNLTLFNINSAGRVAIRGRSSSVTEDNMNFPSRELELVGFTQPILFRHYGSNTGFIVDEFSHGLYSDAGGCYLGASGSGTRVFVLGGGIGLGFSNTAMLGINSIGKIRMGRGNIDFGTTTITPAPSAHVQIITDSTMNSHVTDMLVLSAGPGTTSTMNFVRGFITSDGTSTLQVRRDGFTNLGVGGLGRVYLYEGSNLGIDADPTSPTGSLGLASYMGLGWSSTIAANGTKDTGWTRGAAGIIEQRAGTTSQTYRLYNTYTDINNYERLTLSANRIAYEFAGTGVSRDLTIETTGRLVLSASSLSFNAALPFFFNALSANRISIPTQGVATTNFIAIESPDGNVIGTNNSGGSYSFVTVNNYAANAGPSNPALNTARGQWNFPSVVNAPVGISFNNSMYLLNDTSTTQLIGVSSNRASAGFYFYPKGPFPQPASIFLDSDSNLNLYFAGGGGKNLVLGDGVNNSLVLRYPSNGNIGVGDWAFNTFNTATNNITINQTAGQYGTLFRILSTNSTAMFSVSADGISRFNNNVFVKPNGLIQFTNTSSTTPAIKGTATTVQARTGDDSQYTYLQGKLQTDQAASAGTFTPDKYIILYDSTGTAYKVPVQAL